ncbi:hypothetical protein ACFFTU_32975, partial [Streptomyces cremeus]
VSSADFLGFRSPLSRFFAFAISLSGGSDSISAFPSSRPAVPRHAERRIRDKICVLEALPTHGSQEV